MQKIYSLCKKNGVYFALAMWLLSRGVILLAMLGVAPLLPAPSGGIHADFGWDLFSAWDSNFYEHIATIGYPHQDSGISPLVAFFPLFPLMIYLLMQLGLPFEVAGTSINSLAFAGALIVFYGWVEENHGTSAARWATAILAWCPFSLFGTVIYTEGLFLFLSISALRAFENSRYVWAGFWGILATATRVTGLALVPTFLIVAWYKRRTWRAYVAALATSIGIIGYSLYCWLTFGEPLAFLIVQRNQWQPEQAFWGQGWLKMLAQITIGSVNWRHGGIKDFTHPLIFIIICAVGYWLWRSRSKWGTVKTGYGFCFLLLVLWLLAGDPFINTVMVLGGVYLLWYSRDMIGSLALVYGFFSFGIIFSSGRTVSAERYVYSLVPLAIALGILLKRYPRWGYIAIGFCSVLLALFAIRFAQHQWVA